MSAITKVIGGGGVLSARRSASPDLLPGPLGRLTPARLGALGTSFVGSASAGRCDPAPAVGGDLPRCLASTGGAGAARRGELADPTSLAVERPPRRSTVVLGSASVVALAGTAEPSSPLIRQGSAEIFPTGDPTAVDAAGAVRRGQVTHQVRGVERSDLAGLSARPGQVRALGVPDRCAARVEGLTRWAAPARRLPVCNRPTERSAGQPAPGRPSLGPSAPPTRLERPARLRSLGGGRGRSGPSESAPPQRGHSRSVEDSAAAPDQRGPGRPPHQT